MKFGKPVEDMSAIEKLFWQLDHTDGIAPEVHGMLKSIIWYLEDKETK